MRVRIFTGLSWSTATEYGDYEFDLLPAIGHKLAIASSRIWDVAVVRDIAHRLVARDEAPDIALLMAPPITGGTLDDPLPLALLDESPRPAAATRASPWGAGT